jgi:hypothetical protein
MMANNLLRRPVLLQSTDDMLVMFWSHDLQVRLACPSAKRVRILSLMSTVAVSPSISMEFSADRTLASSKRPRNLCDVFLIVMQQQYARSFTKGKIVLVLTCISNSYVIYCWTGGRDHVQGLSHSTVL